MLYCFLFFFFFKQKTAYEMRISDWSSDVCSSDLICSEDADGLKDDPDMDSSLLGNSLVAGLVEQCDVWPKGKRPEDFHRPLASDVPALLLSGELDPVTPPAYAQRVVRTLPNGRSLVLRGQGHNVIGAGCMPKLFAQFLETADAGTLDVERSEEHTSELQSLMRISSSVFCLKKKENKENNKDGNTLSRQEARPI